MTIAARQHTWRFPYPLVEGQIALAALIWAGFMVTVIGAAIGIASFAEVTGSVMEPATSFVWVYVAFMAGSVVYQSVPMFIANGHTRRDTAIEAIIFMVVFAAAVAFLVTVGYLIEYGVYGFAGWPRVISGDHLFSTHTDVLAIFWESWLTCLAWAAAGGFIGAAVYRYDGSGWLALIPAGVLVSLAGVGSGPQFMGIILRRLPEVETASPALFTLLAGAGFLIALALTWPIVRDMPIRNR